MKVLEQSAFTVQCDVYGFLKDGHSLFSMQWWPKQISRSLNKKTLMRQPEFSHCGFSILSISTAYSIKTITESGYPHNSFLFKTVPS